MMKIGKYYIDLIGSLIVGYRRCPTWRRVERIPRIFYLAQKPRYNEIKYINSLQRVNLLSFTCDRSVTCQFSVEEYELCMKKRNEHTIPCLCLSLPRWIFTFYMFLLYQKMLSVLTHHSPWRSVPLRSNTFLHLWAWSLQYSEICRYRSALTVIYHLIGRWVYTSHMTYTDSITTWCWTL